MRKTSRVVIAHEDCLSWGYGAELSARIANELFPTWMRLWDGSALWIRGSPTTQNWKTKSFRRPKTWRARPNEFCPIESE